MNTVWRGDEMYGPISSEPTFTTAFHRTIHFSMEASQVSTAASLQEVSAGAALPEAPLRSNAEAGLHEAVLSDNWRFFNAYSGIMGMVPHQTEAGDQWCFAFGSRVPLVLRERVNGAGWVLVGAAYVHGYMGGKAVEEWERGKLKAEWIDVH